jgi:hypothetical protein
MVEVKDVGLKDKKYIELAQDDINSVHPSLVCYKNVC